MEIFWKLGWFFKEEWKSYLIGVGALLLLAIINVIPPAILGNIIDQVRTQTLTTRSLSVAILQIVGLAIIVYGLRYVWRMHILGTAARLERKLRLQFFAKLTTLSHDYFQGNRVGDLMAKATSDVGSVQRVAGFGVLQAADSLMTGISVIVAMLLVNVKLSLFVLIPMPFMIIGSQLLSKMIHRTFTIAQNAFSDMNNRVHESVAGIKVTKTFGQEKEEIEMFEKEVEGVYKKNMRVIRYDAAFDPMISIVIVVSYVLLFYIGGGLLDAETITIGGLTKVVGYMNMLIWPMIAIGFLYNTVQRGNVSYDRMNTVFHAKADIVDTNAIVDEVPHGDVVVKVASFAYPDAQVNALTDIQVHIQQGNTLGIVGKTGAGKSTLIKLLLREYNIDYGNIRIGTYQQQDYKLNAYTRAFGYVPQDQFLFSTSIMDNIRFGDITASEERVIEAAKIACVHEDIIAFGEGYETLIGERGVTLSGGQKQRVAIARALLLNPEILILDDSLSAVDAKTETKLLDALKKSRNGKTTIIIAHRLSAVKHAKEIIVLEEGNIQERGSHDELMKLKGWYAQIQQQQEMQREEDM